MTILRLVTLLTLISIKSFGQGVDSLTKDNWLDRQLEIVDIEKSSAEIDLRIHLGIGITNAGQVIWISKSSTGWTGTKYDYFLKMKKGSVTHKVKRTTKTELKSSNWDSLWAKLQALDIMILPTQDEIKDKLRKEVTTKRGKAYQVLNVLDGSSYDLEVKNDKGISNYSFHEPWTFSRAYPEVEEVRKYGAIISTLEKEFQIKFRY